jgi:hypothetical protein
VVPAGYGRQALTVTSSQLSAVSNTVVDAHGLQMRIPAAETAWEGKEG